MKKVFIIILENVEIPMLHNCHICQLQDVTDTTDTTAL